MRRERLGRGIARLVIGASGAAAWLIACATLPVAPIDREADDARTEAAADAAEAAAEADAHDDAPLDAGSDADAADDADASDDAADDADGG